MDQKQHTRRATDWPKLDAPTCQNCGAGSCGSADCGWRGWAAGSGRAFGPAFLPDTRLQVQFRSGVVADNVDPGGLRWTHTGGASDVVRFRVQHQPDIGQRPNHDADRLGLPHAPAYASLADVLQRAFLQASSGKGAERHAQGQPFDRQPMQDLIRLYGQGFALGQAAKKAQESQRLPRERAVAELLGAINYLAGAVIALEAGATTTTTTKE